MLDVEILSSELAHRDGSQNMAASVTISRVRLYQSHDPAAGKPKCEGALGAGRSEGCYELCRGENGL